MRFYVYSFRMKNRIKIRVLAFIAIFAVIFILLLRDNSNSPSREAFNPIQSVATNRSVYAITASLDGNVQLRDFRTFLEVANGLNVKLTFFVSEDFFNSNTETVKEVMRYSHEVGLFIEKDISTLNRNETMRFLAKLNDKFYEKCGRYPKYIRYKHEQEKSGYLFEVLAAFGQYSLANGKLTNPEAGFIVDIGMMDGTSGAKLIAVVTEAVNLSLTTVPLRDLLYSVDIPADSTGTQGTALS